LIRAPTHAPISTEAKVTPSQPLSYSVTELPNGVRVLTESVSVPSSVHLGVLVDYGSRD
jgi:predicted Zn-dependent peptidase